MADARDMAARVAARHLAYAPFRAVHLREEVARSLANRPDQAKGSVITEVLAEMISLMGAPDAEARSLAHRETQELLRLVKRVRS